MKSINDQEEPFTAKTKVQIPRVLIQTLRKLSKTLLDEISPRSYCAHMTAKVPMFCLLLSSGIIGGITSVNFKLAGQLAYGDEGDENLGLIVLLILINIPGMAFQLFGLQMSMKYYDQIEVVPVFLIAVLIFVLLCGMVVLNDVILYKASGLIGIAVGVIFCSIGIYIVIMKNTSIQTPKQANNAEILLAEHQQKRELIKQLIEDGE